MRMKSMSLPMEKIQSPETIHHKHCKMGQTIYEPSMLITNIIRSSLRDSITNVCVCTYPNQEAPCGYEGVFGGKTTRPEPITSWLIGRNVYDTCMFQFE